MKRTVVWLVIALLVVMSFPIYGDSGWTKPVIQLKRTLPDARLGQEYNYQLSVDGGVAPYTWEVYEGAFPEGLSVDEAGVISGTPTEIRKAAYKVKIMVTDSSGKKSNLSIGRALFRITVLNENGEPYEPVSTWTKPVIQAERTLPDARLGEEYNYQLSVDGGVAPYTWEVYEGAFPEGLSMDEYGVITGIPMEFKNKAYKIKVKVVDSSGKKENLCTGRAMLKLTVNDSDDEVVWVVPSITTSVLPTGKVDEEYDFQLEGKDGTAPYTWSVLGSVLPLGLTLSEDGHITGTPTDAGSTEVTILLQDASGKPSDESTDYKTYSITIEEADEEPPVVDVYYVAPDGSNSNPGTFEEPFETTQKALSMITSGGTIVLKAGEYNLDSHILISSKSATADHRIILKGVDREQVTLKRTGRIFNTYTPYVTIQDVTLDGNWGDDDIVKVGGGSDYLVLRNVEIKNTRRDCVDMSGVTGARIIDCIIHDAIWVDGTDRKDAHGIVTGGVHDFEVTGTEIYYVSGDALQFQYGGWDDILIEDCTLWNGPLPTARGGAPAGVYPGENAIDTKHYKENPRGTITIKNVTAYGWKSDYITNAAAFNMKQHIEAIFDGVTVYDSDIGFRLRGPGSKGGAIVTLKNAVLYDNIRPIRYEDDIVDLHIYNVTFGTGNVGLFQSAGGHGTGFEVKNCLFTGTSKPSEASDASNITVDSSNYVDAGNHDYRLAEGSPAIDAGTSIAEVTIDRDGKARDEQIDIGAYEK